MVFGWLLGNSTPKVGGLATFNVDDGFLEAEVRGYRSEILKHQDYTNLSQCETLDDMKLHFAATGYADVFQNEPAGMQTHTLAEKCTLKLVQEFNHIRCQAVEPLATFLDYITYGFMIDNILLLIGGTLRGRNTAELLEKCHPLGMFDSIATLTVATNISDLYTSVLVDTPLAPYFISCLSQGDFGEENIEIIRNKLYKAYLEDFYKFSQELGGVTAEVMGEILKFEADRRVINIVINSFGTELQKDIRATLFPNFGLLYPEGTERLQKADDEEQVRAAMEYYGDYRGLFNEKALNPDKSLEDAFFGYEVKLNKLSFEQQMHYGIFYSWIKLKEQEIKNITWIAECIAQGHKAKINQYITIF